MFDTTSPPDLIVDLSAFGSPELRAANPSDIDLQRAQGSGRIVLSGSQKGTSIVDVFQRFPIRIMFPRVDGCAIKEAVLVNTAGGIAGGDQLETAVTALTNASITVTSQAAEKVYRALSQPARIATKLKVCEGAKLAWLPQETIAFNCARLNRETEIELSSGAELLALEWLVLGRLAHGEEMLGGHITDSWRVRKDGRLIWADTFRATDEMFPYPRHCSFTGVPLRCDLGRRAYCRSLCRGGTLRSEARLAQLSPAIWPRAWTRSFPSSEDVVMLEPL